MTISAEERKSAFRRIYDTYYGHIVAYAHRRAPGNEADDVVADTFLVAWRRLEEIPDGLTLPWLYGVARRVLSEDRRSRSRRGRLVAKVGRHLGSGEFAVPADEGVGDEEIVHQALARLRPHDRELLRLAEWEDLSHTQLAAVFGCTVNAITIRLHRALRRLAAELRTLDRETEIVDAGVDAELG